MEIELLSDEKIDDLQYKGLKIIQKKDGFCFGMDSVLIANFVKISRKSAIVADLGTGTGIISILVVGKQNPKKVYAVEIQEELVDMAKRSVKYNDLEDKIGIESFKDLIPVILTDRDPNFADIDGICFSKITGEERCKLFFCDPYVSNQKPNVENMNKQIRLFFPKGKSVDNYLKSDVKNINKTILNKPLRSLDGNTPKEAFINVFDENIFDKLF